MTPNEKKQLRMTACKVRMGIIEATHGAKSGHPGGSLSAADMFTYLYFKEMNVDPKNPKWEGRDRFVLSKGHTAPGLYSALALRGFFPVEDLPTLRHIDSYLQGHPNMNTVPGVDMSTGSLGQGISRVTVVPSESTWVRAWERACCRRVSGIVPSSLRSAVGSSAVSRVFFRISAASR